MRIAVVAMALGLMAGCATTVQPIGTAKPVEIGKLHAYTQQSEGSSAEIAVVRDSGMSGGACDVALYINGRLGAYIGPGRLARFYVPSGPITLGVGPSDNGLCKGPAVRTIETTAQSDEPRYFRISLDTAGIYIGPYVENLR